MTCKNGHEAAEGQKFCGTCAEPLVVEALKCVHCEGTLLKSYAFCPGCAKPVGNDEESFKGALALLDDFRVRRPEFEKAHAAPPTVDPKTVDLAAVHQLLKANTATVKRDGADVEELDLGPVVVELLKSVTALTKARDLDAGHVTAHLANIGEGVARMAGVVSAMAGRLATVDESLKSLRDGSRGRRGLVAAFERPGGTGGAAKDPDDVEAADIRTAMNHVIKSKPEMLTMPEVSRLTELTSAGASLKAIDEYSKPLGAAARRALKFAQGQAA